MWWGAILDWGGKRSCQERVPLENRKFAEATKTGDLTHDNRPADSPDYGACALHNVAEPAAGDVSTKYNLVCDKKQEFLQSDPTVMFMLRKLEEAGCRLPEERIVVAECEPGYPGRYLGHSLEICYNNYQGDPQELRNTMVHELIHAYDECRAKDFDWGNCRHIACSEIRAARLSGDCSMRMELARGRLPWPGYEKACVRRRAELSVASLPHCKLSSVAAVLSNFDSCYNDTAPFSRPP